MLYPDFEENLEKNDDWSMRVNVSKSPPKTYDTSCTYKKVLHKIIHTSNLMMKVDPTARRYSLSRFGREPGNEPHIVIPLFIWFIHVKHISKYVEVKNGTLEVVLRSDPN